MEAPGLDAIGHLIAAYWLYPVAFLAAVSIGLALYVAVALVRHVLRERAEEREAARRRRVRVDIAQALRQSEEAREAREARHG